MQHIVLRINNNLTKLSLFIFPSIPVYGNKFGTFEVKEKQMILSAKKVNTFNFFKLPLVWWSGIRVIQLDESVCVATVKHRWINQNPFRSMFWAVQGMAAELTTGALVMGQIRENNKNISMLVRNNNASFTKKATGRITFSCDQGEQVKNAIQKTVETGEGQTIWMESVGVNENGVVVSTFNFEWTVKIKG